MASLCDAHSLLLILCGIHTACTQLMIIMRLGEILEGYNSETDKFEPPENREEYDRLIGKKGKTL